MENWHASRIERAQSWARYNATNWREYLFYLDNYLDYYA